MVKNRKILENLVDDHNKKHPLTLGQKFKLLDSMWAEGKRLGVLPPKNPLEGLETDIRLAKILNSCSKK